MKYLAANALARLNILGPSQCMQAFLLFSGSAMFSDSTCQEYKYVSQVCFLCYEILLRKCFIYSTVLYA